MTITNDLCSILEQAAKQTAHTKPLVILQKSQANAFGWDELFVDSCRYASWLRELGIQKDDKIALIMPTSYTFLCAFFASLHLGATPVPLYPPMRLGKMDEYFHRTATMLKTAHCRLLLCDPLSDKFLGRILDLYQPELGIKGCPSLADLDAFSNFARQRSHYALIQFSSGTTVAPKAVALTHEQLLANMRFIYEYVERRPDDRMLSWLPLYHDMGLVGAVLGTLYGAAPLTLLRPEEFLARPAFWLEAISTYKATISVAPNFAYNLCTSKIVDAEIDDLDLASWRIAMNGAEPVTIQTMKKFHRKFARAGFRMQAFKPVYGLSEATLAVTMTNVAATFRTVTVSRSKLQNNLIETGDDLELVSVGHPLPGMQLDIRDAALSSLPERRIGQIWIKGASVMEGYYGSASQPFIDGWLDTGDEGFLDNGELFVVGRSKDIIIINGKNHVPQDIEAVVNEIPAVRTGCVVAVGHCDEEGERLLIFAESRNPTPGQLEQFITKQVTSVCHIRPNKIVLCQPGTLPRTSSGKLRRRETLRQYLSGTLVPPQKVNFYRLSLLWLQSRLSQRRAKKLVT